MQRLRSVWSLVLVAVLALVAAPLAHADDEHPSWRIPRYEQRIVLDRAGNADITLELDFDFARDTGRGPYLWFPLRQRVADNPDVWRAYDVRIVSVTSPTGASTEVLQDIEDGNLVVRVGSENRRDLNGVQQYVINYTVRGLVEPNAASALDEFNANVVGLGWKVPIDDVRVEVTGPAGVERVACFWGTSFDRSCEAASDGATATFTAGPLREGEGVQAVAGFPVGTFVGAEPRYEKRYHPGNLFPLTPLSGGLTATLTGLGVVGLLVLARRRRDESYVGLAPGTTPLPGQKVAVGQVRPATVAVQFTPPKGVTPGEVGTLMDAAADNVDVSATLVDLAVRGHLRITEEGKKKWKFTRLDRKESLTKAERHLLDTLFRSGREVRTDEMKGHGYEKLFPGTRQRLDDRVTKELKWFPVRPSATRALVWVGAVGLVLAGVVIGVVLAFAFGLGLVGLAPVFVAVALVALGRRFARRTAAGSAVLAQAKGFELYLTTAEADQIRFEEGVDVFSRYLPYAIVFGVAERWAKIFQQLAAEGRYQPDTTWYGGPTGYFYAPGFAHSIGSLGHELGASLAMSTAPSGGSGGGGGSGFSGGGGFGGGGGGGW